MIHERLAALLKELQMSQRKFASIIGINPSYMSRMVQGKSVPPDRILLLIERVFNVNKEWLERGEGEMFEAQSRSLARRQLLELIPTLNEAQVTATRAFLRYLQEEGKSQSETETASETKQEPNG